jgi:primosomal protein N' (replication factor Y)
MMPLPPYADVLVPLPLPNLLTYATEGVEDALEVGMRVVVQVGARKRYTGVVCRLHQDAPKGYAARAMDAVVDDRPVVTPGQLRMWEWMAGYYMCTRGEVMAAALPSGLKLSSQTRLVVHPEANIDDLRSMAPQAQVLFDAIELRKGLQLSEAAEVLDVKHPQRWVNQLVQAQLIVSEEEWKERYKPKTERTLQLPEPLRDEAALGAALDELDRRAPKQARILTAFLQLVEEQGGERDAIVSEKEVLVRADADAAAVKRMEAKGLWERGERVVDASEQMDANQPVPLPALSAHQSEAYAALRASQQAGRMALLHGVTGSGKTEVYIHLIADALERGETVLFLVPEIALTTQLIQRLSHHFAAFLHVYHSRFTRREQTETWLEVLGKGRPAPKLIVGPRSALFLPMQQLGLVIVDEEHEPSFKQYDPAPRYQARDVAMWMAARDEALCVLGSATPSVETHWLTTQGRIDRVEMNERYGGVMLPEIWCADLRKAHRQRAMFGHFTRLLKLELESVLESGRQVILFQNRRGYSPMWQCETCAWIPECERCDVPLTVHKWKNELNCHHCGYVVDPPPPVCVSCGKSTMKPKGLGTERIEEELAEHFPDARVARMDADTTRSRHGHQRLVRAFANREFDILVGTQMVTKGLDFAHVGLVGVLSADRMLNFPDFRSFERAYQMLTQVAGRAGRSGERGKVILQTYNPDHWVMTKVMANDYMGLVQQELIERKNYRYPPFVRLVRLTLKHTDVQRLEAAAEVLAARLTQRFMARVIGPETPMISRINDLHHRVLLLKFERELRPDAYKELLQADLDAFQADERFKRIRLIVDVDPA